MRDEGAGDHAAPGGRPGPVAAPLLGAAAAALAVAGGARLHVLGALAPVAAHVHLHHLRLDVGHQLVGVAMGEVLAAEALLEEGLADAHQAVHGGPGGAQGGQAEGGGHRGALVHHAGGGGGRRLLAGGQVGVLVGMLLGVLGAVAALALLVVLRAGLRVVLVRRLDGLQDLQALLLQVLYLQDLGGVEQVVQVLHLGLQRGGVRVLQDLLERLW